MRKLKINKKRLERLTSKCAASVVPHTERVKYEWCPIDEEGHICVKVFVYAKAYDHTSSEEVYYVKPEEVPPVRKRTHPLPLAWKYRQNEEVMNRVKHRGVGVHLDPWKWRTEITFDRLTKSIESDVVPLILSPESNPDWRCSVGVFYDKNTNSVVNKMKNNKDVYTFCYKFMYTKWIYESDILQALEDL